MNLTTSRLNSVGAKLTVLLGTASLLTMAGAMSVHAQQIAQGQLVAQAQPQVGQNETPPEQVLITGSLIRGAAAVGENEDIEFVSRLSSQQGLTDDCLRSFGSEILIDRTTVNRDLTLARTQKHARHGGLSPARTQMLN